MLIGVFLGAPIATRYYNLTIPAEVVQLFVLMPFVYFYTLVPLCFVIAFTIIQLCRKSNVLVHAVCISLCMVIIPVIFYGIGVSNYYN